MNPLVELWTALGAAAALATIVLVHVGALRGRQLAVPAGLIVVTIVSALASSAVPAVVWLPFVCSALACTAVALSAAVGQARVAALICLLFVAVGTGVYLARSFGGFVVLGSGYAAATALLVAMAAIAVVRHSRVRRPAA